MISKNTPIEFCRIRPKIKRIIIFFVAKSYNYYKLWVIITESGKRLPRDGMDEASVFQKDITQGKACYEN